MSQYFGQDYSVLMSHYEALVYRYGSNRQVLCAYIGDSLTTSEELAVEYGTTAEDRIAAALQFALRSR